MVQKSDENGSIAKAYAKDTSLLFKHQDEDDVKEGWTSFNQNQSEESLGMTSIGYMPIILTPAHALNTVKMQTCGKKKKIGQNHVIVTKDEALFCKLMELKWANTDYLDCIIVRLGGLHTAMKFMVVIGKHIQSSGLLEAWVEGNLFGH